MQGGSPALSVAPLVCSPLQPSHATATAPQVALTRGYPASSVTAWSYLVGAFLLFPVAAGEDAQRVIGRNA
eukprot:3075755-Prymnesium_polylepis.1